MVGECSRAVKDPCSPVLATPGAGLAYEDAPLADRPAGDQPAAVGAVAEGVGLLAAAMPYGFWSRLSSASSSWTLASALTRASRSASARPCWSS